MTIKMAALVVCSRLKIISIICSVWPIILNINKMKIELIAGYETIATAPDKTWRLLQKSFQKLILDYTGLSLENNTFLGIFQSILKYFSKA